MTPVNLTHIPNILSTLAHHKLHLDLGEIQGFRYHNGIVFSAYTKSAGYSLSKGGRYDGLRKLDNEPRPAVGFDLDLLAVAGFTQIDI